MASHFEGYDVEIRGKGTHWQKYSWSRTKREAEAHAEHMRKQGWETKIVPGIPTRLLMGNPAVKLPSKFTPAEMRVNEQGKVQIRINPARIGSGGRFAKCVESVEAKGGAADPRAVCAAAGRKKYGKQSFQAMAQAGRKRAAHNPRKRITSRLSSDGYYYLQRGNEHRHIGAGRANTVLANAGWPTGAREREILWQHATIYTPKSGNPSKRSVIKRVRKALTKYVRSQTKSNPGGMRHWTVKVPKTPYDSGYTLSIKAQTKRSALNQAREYCAGQWAKYTGKPKTKYRLPRGTKATETA